MRYPVWRSALFLIVLAFPCVWLYEGILRLSGPDPGKVLVDNFGLGALILLLCSLAMTPLRQLTNWGLWLAVRRQLGLWCFVYVLLHLSAYLLFLLGLRMERLASDLVERPYIMVGALALSGLIPLALTSNRRSQRLLGRRWKKLHRLVYPVLGLALLHMLWVVRSDAGEWAAYAAVGGMLMLLRLPLMAGRLRRLRAGIMSFLQKRVDAGV